MTAVVQLAPNDWPVLIGDILVSSVMIPGFTNTTKIPSIDELPANFTNNMPKVPTDLRQKIAIISKRLIVGWSGETTIARQILREMMRMNSEEAFTNDTLQAYLDGKSSNVWDQIQLLGFIKDNKEVNQFGRSDYGWNTNHLGRVGLIGSGSRNLEQFLGQLERLPESSESKLNLLEQAVSIGVSIVGSLLNAELTTLDSINNLYGGGYEIASLVNGDFAKIDDISYLFWKLRYEDNGDKIFIEKAPRRVIRIAYYDDLLISRTAWFLGEGKDTRVEQKAYGVPPIYREITSDELSNAELPSFNARWLCNLFILELPNGTSGIQSFLIYRGSEKKQCVNFIEDGKCIRGVEVESKFLEEVSMEVRKRIREVK